MKHKQSLHVCVYQLFNKWDKITTTTVEACYVVVSAAHYWGA